MLCATNQLECCGMWELYGFNSYHLSRDWLDRAAITALSMLTSSDIEENDEFYEGSGGSAFVMSEVPATGRAFSGTKLAELRDFIKKNKLGNFTYLSAKKNPNSGNYVIPPLWSPCKKGLTAYLKSKGLPTKPPKKEDRYSW